MRKAKIYAGEVEVNDRVKRRIDGDFGRVWRIREMSPGRYEFAVAIGGDDEFFERNDNSFVWIEIP